MRIIALPVAERPRAAAPVYFWEELGQGLVGALPGAVAGGIEWAREREAAERAEEERRAAEAAAAAARAAAEAARLREAAQGGGVPTWALVGGGLAAAGLLAYAFLR